MIPPFNCTENIATIIWGVQGLIAYYWMFQNYTVHQQKNLNQSVQNISTPLSKTILQLKRSLETYLKKKTLNNESASLNSQSALQALRWCFKFIKFSHAVFQTLHWLGIEGGKINIKCRVVSINTTARLCLVPLTSHPRI